jgi:glycosyltransferase involved in cell wall biosynthesis
MTDLAGLRLAVIVPSLRGGGLERVTTDLTMDLARRGLAPQVFALGGLGVYAEQLEAAGIACHDLQPRGPRLRGVPLALIAALRRFRADVIHAHSGTWYPAAVARTVLRGPRLVFTDHGRYPPEPLLRALVERWCARRTDAVVAVSAAAGAYVAKFLRLRRAPVVIENGIDLAPYHAARANRERVRREWGIEARDVALVALGRLAPVKNHALLLAALARALPGAPRLRLLVIGQGPLEADLRACSAALNLGGHVTFLGYRRDVPACLAGADVFVNTSTTEGLPIALLEALASGLAIVATAVGGVPATLGDPPAGLLVPSGDADAVAAALLAVGTDDAERARLAGAARERAAAFVLGRCTQRYYDLYRELLTRVS